MPRLLATPVRPAKSISSPNRHKNAKSLRREPAGVINNLLSLSLLEDYPQSPAPKTAFGIPVATAANKRFLADK
jgi:hypothetical protein